MENGNGKKLKCVQNRYWCDEISHKIIATGRTVFFPDIGKSALQIRPNAYYTCMYIYLMHTYPQKCQNKKKRVGQELKLIGVRIQIHWIIPKKKQVSIWTNRGIMPI